MIFWVGGQGGGVRWGWGVGSRLGGGGLVGGGQGGSERIIEVFVKIQKKKKFFFWGGGVGRVRGVGNGVGSGWM